MFMLHLFSKIFITVNQQPAKTFSKIYFLLAVSPNKCFTLTIILSVFRIPWEMLEGMRSLASSL